MWIVLCGATDIPALWAYHGLKARGLAPLEVVSAEMLTHSLHWEHRLNEDGASISITLANGRTIFGTTVRGVLNRLLSASSEHLRMVNPDDSEYAVQEFTAFFMSWLYALPGPVLNRPTPQGLPGQFRHISEWAWLASQAGLSTPNYRQSSGEYTDTTQYERLVPSGTPVTTVLVVSGHVVGDHIPPGISEGCQRLARLAKTELLGIEFATHTDHWIFVGATPFPDLRLGGQAFLDVLASVMKGREGVP